MKTFIPALSACLLAAGCAAPMKAPEGPGATYEITDSGTNNATTYKADKIAANPFAPITLNDAPMFLQKGAPVPVGTATIRRIGG